MKVEPNLARDESWVLVRGVTGEIAKARGKMSYEQRRKWLWFVGVGIVVVLGGFPGSALAAEAHAFKPVLSLTGDCSTSALDPVPDPGPCPGTPGIDHPKTPFSSPAAVATDAYGDIYVAVPGPELALGKGGRIDVFGPDGNFITEVPDDSGPGSVAVDSEGYLYVANRFNGRGVIRYKPSVYEPAGNIAYEAPTTLLAFTPAAVAVGLEIGRGGNAEVVDRLFIQMGTSIDEYESAADGNHLVEEIGKGEMTGDEVGLAVDVAHGRIYASTSPVSAVEVKAFELAPPHNFLFAVKSSSVPGGKFVANHLSLAADEGSGHLFGYDAAALPPRVYEFETSNSGASYVSTIEHGFLQGFGTKIGVDNGENSPNGALLDPESRYLFVPSRGAGIDHSYAFGPSTVRPPEVESASFANVGEAEAELQASIEPGDLETHYAFFIGGKVVGEGEIPAGATPIEVAAAAEGLAPATTYSFRVVAENEEGSDEAEREFATYPAAEAISPCPNEALRGGFSTLLPDCRAYELVTQPDTNARTPHGVSNLGTYFATREASPSGAAVSFQIEGGLIPGSEGTGSFGGDPYLSIRGEGGWSTAGAGPSGSEAAALVPGSTSPDQGYSFWDTGGLIGSAVVEGKTTFYVRYPDGHSALIGRGSLGDDPRAGGKLISEGGGHIIFTSGSGSAAIQLEPNAPPDGTTVVYDRTANEVTHVVSLLPEDETPKAGEDATYEGASLDGRGVAFKIGTTLYLRFDDEETFEIGDGAAFAGIAEGGARIFYLEGGKLWRFDAANGERKAFSTGPVNPVNVSADGSTAYFVSTAKLTAEPNPNGVKAVNGKENLYRSEEGAISFVGTVTEEDVVSDGLGLWADVIGNGGLGADPSRTTPDGDALLFESRAALAGYDPEGHAEVYRYDFAGNSLQCLSCNPTLAPAASDASLQSVRAGQGDPEPFSSFAYVTNLRADGNRAFFQSDEALVPADVDGLQDVYEWEAQGIGSCNRPGGCVYLVSSGHSLRIDYLYGAGDSGDDVFFRTSDILLGRDAEETPSIYDARVGGGFAEPVEDECQGEGCRPGVSPAPTPPNLASQVNGPSGNVPARCPKGKHKVRRHGKTVCVKKKHHKKHHHKQAGKSKGAGR
jgi:hypothetical protein